MEGKNRQTRIEPSKSAQEGGNTFWKKRIIDKVVSPDIEYTTLPMISKKAIYKSPTSLNLGRHYLLLSEN